MLDAWNADEDLDSFETGRGSIVADGVPNVSRANPRVEDCASGELEQHARAKRGVQHQTRAASV